MQPPEGKHIIRTGIRMGGGTRYMQRGCPLEGSQWGFEVQSEQCNGGKWRPRLRVGGGFVDKYTPQPESQPPIYRPGFTEPT